MKKMPGKNISGLSICLTLIIIHLVTILAITVAQDESQPTSWYLSQLDSLTKGEQNDEY
jgi:hypothetical protein